MHRTESKNFTRDAKGNNIYKNGPPGTTIAAEEMNAIQEEICYAIEQTGIQLKTRNNDTHDQLYAAMASLVGTGFDIIITNQTQFNSIIERTGANAYQFKDQYNSIYLKDTSGGYQMSGTTSILSGGDVYGILSTNNIDLVFAENTEAYIDFADTAGYVNINTDNCNLMNVWVRGTGSAAVAIAQSFMVDGYYCTLTNCRTSHRKSNTSFAGFRGSATLLKRETCKYSNCTARNLTSSNVCYGFNRAFNANNCLAYSITSTGNDAYGYLSGSLGTNCFAHTITGNIEGYGFSSCVKMSSCVCNNVTATTTIAYGFSNCSELSSCECENLNGNTGSRGYNICNNVTGCNANDLNTTGSSSRGFESCNNVSGCNVTDIDSSGTLAWGFSSCKNVSACNATDIVCGSAGTSVGFTNCNNVTGCTAHDIVSPVNRDAIGFSTCKIISGCSAETIDSSGTGDCTGFEACSYISACYANDIDSVNSDAIGFDTCLYGSSLFADNITSSGANEYGFESCQYLSSCSTTEAANPNCDFVDTTDVAIANQFSCHATNWT